MPEKEGHRNAVQYPSPYSEFASEWCIARCFSGYPVLASSPYGMTSLLVQYQALLQESGYVPSGGTISVW